MNQLYPECSKCRAERTGIGPDRCETIHCPGKRNEWYRKEIDNLTETYCANCKTQTFDHCNYHCSVGAEIHKYDCLIGNGAHSRW